MGKTRMEPLDRLYGRSSIGSANECWEWKGSCYTHPVTKEPTYGCFWLNGTRMGAHRASYILNVGPIPDGMSILHSCDNPKCVNLAHLHAGTLKENTQDMLGKQRNRNRRGDDHPYALLTTEKVKEIRAHPEISNREFSERFNVDISAIRAVRQCKTWKHIK